MKKSIVTLVFLFVLSVCQAQFVVVDPGHIAATIANGGLITKVKNTMEDINTVSNTIRNTVQDIRELQQNIDAALWEVKDLIKGDDFGFGNIRFEMDATARISPNINQYAGGILPGDHPLLEGYRNGSVTLGADILHEVFDFDFEESIPNSLEGLQDLHGQKIMNREIFSYATTRKTIQIALTYNQLAEVMLAKAEQLNGMLRRSGAEAGFDNALKMNEAERIQLLESTSSYVRKSLELRLLCDQLIRNEISQPNAARDNVLRSYQNFLICNKLFGE